jgi:hypothetical protein
MRAGENGLAMVDALADELASDLATKDNLEAAVQQLRAEIHRSRADIMKVGGRHAAGARLRGGGDDRGAVASAGVRPATRLQQKA